MPNIRDLEPEPLVVPLSLDGSEVLTFDVGRPPHSMGLGWAAYHQGAGTPAGNVWILLRFGPESAAPCAPLEVRELQVSSHVGGAVFGSPLLRAIPFSRMTAAVNHPDRVGDIRKLTGPANLMSTGGPPGSGLISWTLPPRRRRRMATPDLRVKDPGGRRKPDEFYEKVTRTYLSAAVVSNRPAQDLADANRVPVTTVHRWLKEARNRGFLRLPDPRRHQQEAHHE